MAEASWKLTGFHLSLLGSRLRRAAMRPVPAASSMCSQDPGDCLAVPELLVVPQREESGHLRVAMGPGDQDVAEVADRVVLHVVHVAQASERFGVEGPLTEGVEVDVVEVELLREVPVGGDVEGHAPYSSPARSGDDHNGALWSSPVVGVAATMHSHGRRRATDADSREPASVVALQAQDAGGVRSAGVVGQRPCVCVVGLKALGTGYWPSTKLRMAACCISTGWILAATFTDDVAFTALTADW